MNTVIAVLVLAMAVGSASLAFSQTSAGANAAFSDLEPQLLGDSGEVPAAAPHYSAALPSLRDPAYPGIAALCAIGHRLDKPKGNDRGMLTATTSIGNGLSVGVWI